MQLTPGRMAHAKDDRAVVSDNSRMFHETLKAKGVATEYLELLGVIPNATTEA